MSRVKAVVENAIKVSIYDVVPGDVILVRGNELDPIVSEVQIRGEDVKYIYRHRPQRGVQETLWMIPADGAEVFIHDLKRERFEFIESQDLQGI